MSLETVNLVKAKALAGDWQWLKAEFIYQCNAAPITDRASATNFMCRLTGYHSLQKFALSATINDVMMVCPEALRALLTRDFSKLSSEPPTGDSMTARIDGKNVPLSEVMAKVSEMAAKSGASVVINYSILINEPKI